LRIKRHLSYRKRRTVIVFGLVYVARNEWSLTCGFLESERTGEIEVVGTTAQTAVIEFPKLAKLQNFGNVEGVCKTRNTPEPRNTPEHPGTLPEHPRNTPGTSHNTPEHPRNSKEHPRNTKNSGQRSDCSRID